MHLLESASRYMNCTPVVHEVSAGIAAEYFNQASDQKAFALVTAGPGLTNLVTSISGAWLESRELLVIGGQVKRENLKGEGIRQGGIQEIDGISIVKPITKRAIRIEAPIHENSIMNIVSESYTGRPGPVFLEVCLDASAAEINPNEFKDENIEFSKGQTLDFGQDLSRISSLVKSSKRPLVLIGNGVTREAAKQLQLKLSDLQIPIATTWSGADRVGADYKYYAGRPNNFGMRWANIFQQQADLLIVVGSSLGLQQTGFNTNEFLPNGQIIHVDIDKSELDKPNPKNRTTLQMDSARFLEELPSMFSTEIESRKEWIALLEHIKREFLFVEDCQKSQAPFLSPHEVIYSVSTMCDSDSQIVICSSGGTFTAGMQCFENKNGQILLSNKGLASMGYGLAGAIGLAMSRQEKQTLLFEGDGGFAQNLQELGTVFKNNLNLKIFLVNNEGYASIRTSQKNYFQGHYLGCDTTTGLGFPSWEEISNAYKISYLKLKSGFEADPEFQETFTKPGPVIFEIVADPDQMYLPRVHSVINPDGTMASSPIHDMLPKLPEEIAEKVFSYISIPK